jgi:agmatine/peptidylarginine deiminase
MEHPVKEKKLLWMILPEAPDEFFEILKQVNPKSFDELIPVLAQAENMGWVKILGSTEESGEDIAKALSKESTVLHVKLDKKNKKPRNRG